MRRNWVSTEKAARSPKSIPNDIITPLKLVKSISVHQNPTMMARLIAKKP
jgi:hypothetical protein